MNKFDRIIFRDNFVKGNKTINSGSIGTIREFIEGKPLIQVDFIDGQPDFILAPTEYINIVSMKDLDTLQTLNDCIKIMNIFYHPNNSYISKDGTIYTIKGIRLSSNELHDEFIVSVQNGTLIESKTISRKFLDDNTSLLSHGYENKEENKEQINNLMLNKDPIEVVTEGSEPHNNTAFSDDDIQIIVGKFKFISNGKQLEIPTINVKDFDNFNKAMDKLKEFMNER